MDRLVDILRELGAGFAFVGRQVHVDVDVDDFYVDLPFFHVTQVRYWRAADVSCVCVVFGWVALARMVSASLTQWNGSQRSFRASM